MKLPKNLKIYIYLFISKDRYQLLYKIYVTVKTYTCIFIGFKKNLFLKPIYAFIGREESWCGSDAKDNQQLQVLSFNRLTSSPAESKKLH
ncbi:hypothetical protein KUTeg_018437 [Tegillarca granosa]|uniref:Uncharacterized protein n=1 Tax=Tegillarca granosa TaxID=220873 RepID=A0ABQ9EHV2_TEGGR|nr:hypothetical protein KUTeg_018437 [Tegillarca granosa]